MAFCQDWLKKWKWTQNFNWSGARQTYGSFIQLIDSGIQQLRDNSGNPTALQNAKRTLENAFANWDKKGATGVLAPSDLRALLVLKVEQENGEVAAFGCLSHFLRAPMNLFNQGPVPSSLFAGISEALLFEKGVTDPTPFNAEILTNFMGRQEQNFSELQSTFQNSISDAAENLKQSNAQLVETKENAVKQAEKFQGQVNQANDDLQSMRKSLLEELSMRAPVKYWSDKAKSHGNSARRLGWAVALASALLLDAVLGIIWIIIRISGGQKPELWELGSAALVTGLLLYLLRIIVKIQLSHLHLSTDAEQRAVMVQTYLSLEHHKEIMTKEDRHLILEALFRPVGAGLVKDDQSSLSVIEFLLSKKSGN